MQSQIDIKSYERLVNIMKKEDIQYEVTELDRMIQNLQGAQMTASITAHLMPVYYNMCDLMAEADYADAAEAIIQCMEKYENQDISKAKEEVLRELKALIERMQEDLQRPEETSKVESVCKEIRDVCGSVAGIISHEAKVAWEEAGKVIKQQEMPECTGAIADMKKIPKRFERNLKRGIKNWLKSDK